MSLFAPANVSDEDSAPRARQESGDPLARNHNPQAQVNPSSELGLQFLSEGGMLSALAKVVMDSVGADGIALAYAVNGSMVCRASCGNHAPPVGTPVNLNSGIGAQCLREGKTVTCSDTETDPRVNKNVCRAIGVRSMLAAPLRRNGRLSAWRRLFTRKPTDFRKRRWLNSRPLQSFSFRASPERIPLTDRQPPFLTWRSLLTLRPWRPWRPK